MSRVLLVEVSTRWRRPCSSVSGFSAGSPAHRRQLIDQPELIPVCRRRAAPDVRYRQYGASRQRNFEYKGMLLHAGERVRGHRRSTVSMKSYR